MSLNLQFSVFSDDGSEAVLEDQLTEGWSLLVFLRHSDCIECQLITHELNAILDALKQWSVSLTLVANCSWEDLKPLRDTLQLQPAIQLLTEPSLQVHQAVGLQNHIMGGFGPKALWNILKGTQKGFHQKLSLGENMGQQSGLFLLRPNRELVWSHRSNHLGDIPSQATILEAVLAHRALDGVQ